MATALIDLERLTVHSPPTFLVQKKFQSSFPSGSRRLPGSWNFSDVGQGLALGLTRFEQKERSRRRIIIAAKKEQSWNGGPREARGPDVKFDSTDMMELEFGRLLGEDRQTTVAKVLGKKMNPELTYVKIEKEKELQEQKDSARRPSPSRFSAPVRPDFKLREKANEYSTDTSVPGTPDLIPPPVRPPNFEEVDASPVRTTRVAPFVRSGGGKKSLDADPYALQALIRKPSRVSEAEKSLPPARPEKEIIAPVPMRRKETGSLDILPKPGNRLLRTPSSVRGNSFGESLTSDQISPSTSESEDDIDPDYLSEKRFKQLLDGGSLGRQGGQSSVSKASALKNITPTIRRVVPSLVNKPTILEKPEIADRRKSLFEEHPSSPSSAGAESSTGFQDTEVSNSLSPRAKLSGPPLGQQTNPEVIVVNEFLREEDEGNVVEDVKTDGVISLEETVQVPEAIPVNILRDDPQNSKEGNSSLPVVETEREDTRLGNVDVQGSNKEATSVTAARKPVMRLRETSLPLQQTALSKDNGSLVDSTSKTTTSAQHTDVQDQATTAPYSAFERQEEEGLMVREQAIKEEEQESTPPKTRQSAPGLKLARPASPAAFTSKKDGQVDTTFNNLQKAISSFDQRRIVPNKKEKDEDWARAEALRDSEAIEELEIIGTGRGGLLVGFGSLVGYLPAFELKAERRPVSFNVWAQTKGYDTKTKKYTEDEENLDNHGFTTTSIESTTSSFAQASGGLVDALEQRSSKAIDPKLQEQFRKERAEELSLLVGQKVKVIVTSVDRTVRQLRFSEKQAEGEGQELSQRKITLMESLNVGDVVSCQVKKITTFGAFVDLQGVPALIHSSELSWNRNVDPVSAVQVGQEVKAKVCRLDRFLQRINLSLKLMQPDPLLETLESLVSPDADIIGASADVESQVEKNEELNRFIGKLERSPDISAVKSGRRVRGAALAPDFQIYLSGPLDNGYKLLARFGNEVQEVVVETSVDRERMKSFIRDSTVQDT